MNLQKPNGSYHPILTEGDLKDLAYVLNDFASVISIDTETTGLNPLECELVGIAITHKPMLGYYIPVAGDWTNQFEQLSLFALDKKELTLEIIRKYLNPILSNPNKLKIFHNGKYDLHVLHRFDFDIQPPYYDTMLATQVLVNCEGNKYGLKPLAKNHLKIEMTEYKEVAGKQPFYNVPIKEATAYAAADVDMTLRLKTILDKAYTKFPSLESTLNLEFESLPVLKEMETHGCLVDVDYLKRIGKVIRGRLNTSNSKILDTANSQFNVNSEQQLKEVLNHLLRTSLPDTSEKTLKTLVDKHPIIEQVMEYRKLNKLYGTYVKGIIERLTPEKRLHTEFWQIKKTGRLSSNDPNMQNLPTLKEDSPDDYSIRRAIIVPKGYKFVSIDYSQLELRIITHISQEPTWIKAFEENQDIHSATAQAIFGEVTKDLRKKAKIVNFGLLYGQSPFGLSWRMELSIEEAEAFIKKYFSVLPNVGIYIEEKKQDVITKKYVETPMGRRLYFKYNEHDPKSVGAAQREGINFPIQGCAADIVKTAMVDVQKLLVGYKTKMILQVHDELDFEMAEDEMDILIPQIKDIMSNAMELCIPLRVDVEYGDNWEDLKEW